MFGLFGRGKGEEEQQRPQQGSSMAENTSFLNLSGDPIVSSNSSSTAFTSSTHSLDAALTEDQQALLQVYQMKAMYELTTKLAGKCFDRCILKLGSNLDDNEKVCVNNCVARYFDMKLFFTRQLVQQN